MSWSVLARSIPAFPGRRHHLTLLTQNRGEGEVNPPADTAWTWNRTPFGFDRPSHNQTCDPATSGIEPQRPVRSNPSVPDGGALPARPTLLLPGYRDWVRSSPRPFPRVGPQPLRSWTYVRKMIGFVRAISELATKPGWHGKGNQEPRNTRNTRKGICRTARQDLLPRAIAFACTDEPLWPLGTSCLLCSSPLSCVSCVSWFLPPRLARFATGPCGMESVSRVAGK